MPITERDIRELREALVEWYNASRRELPWRATTDPYAIWASEVMLQQTQVSRVAEYWPRFLERFPSVSALAKASMDEVLAAWSGLGYYRRARMFRRAARAVVEEYGGELPRSADDLRGLPGVGDYTSAAVASIAFGEAVPAVDANAARVLARVLGFRGDTSRASARRALEDEALRMLDPERPGDSNQALMELGALVCLPAAPRCDDCPVMRLCAARASGEPASYPGPTASPPGVELREAVAVVRKRGAVLLSRQEHERGWWAGMWTLPRTPLCPDDDPRAALSEILRGRFGIECRLAARPIEVKYSVTRHRVTALAFDARWVRGAPGEASGGRWISWGDPLDVGVPAPYRAIVERILWGDRGRP